MNSTPIVFGWPQFVLLILAVAGLGLLISAGMGMRRQRIRHPYESDEEARRHGWYDKPEHRRIRYRRHFRWGRGVSGLFLIIVAIALLWLASLMQTYLGLTSDIRVAQVRAHAVSNIPHMMSVELVLYDNNGNQASDNTYLVQGDEWMLQGDIIKYPSWLNIFGLHSGYKLTRLEGRFDDPNMERTSQHTVVDLNGGDDNFFKSMRNQNGGFLSNFVEASYGNAVFLTADGGYDVFVSQTGLWAKRAA